MLHDGGEIALLDVREAGPVRRIAPALRDAAALQHARAGRGAAGAAQVDAHRPLRRRRRRERPARCETPRSRRLHRRGAARRRQPRLGASRLRSLQGSQRSEQALRRAGRARLPHAARHRAGARAHEASARKFRDRGRPSVRRVHEDEHPRRHLLPERRASLPHTRNRAGPGREDHRQLRRSHAFHHRRADADQFRRREPRLRSRERHAGLGAR